MKNLHIVVYKNLLPGIQVAFQINELTTTTINLTSGVEILRTAVLDGSKLLEVLEVPKTSPEAVQCVLEHVKVEEAKAKTLEEMVAHTRFLVAEYGTENEKRYIGKFLEKVLT